MLTRVSSHLKAVGFNTRMEGSRVEAVNGRDHNLIATVLLIIFAFPIGLIYYFTRKKNKITAIAETNKCSLTYEGKKAFAEAEKLSQLLKG